MISYLGRSIVSLSNIKLSLKLINAFTIKNYMKTFEIQNVQRTPSHLKHQIFRVDQLKQFSKDSQSTKQFIEGQNQKYQKKRKLWAQRTQKYYSSTSQRRDLRTQSTQQQYDDYSYSTSVKYHKQKQYTVINRRNNLTRKQQVVLDIMQYYSLKKHYKTIQLVSTAFSQSHRYLAFGYDLNNNQHIRWMLKDTSQNRIVGVKGWEANVLQQANQLVFYNDRGVFFTKTQNRRPSKLYYQQFDTQPQLILQEKDPSYWLYIQLSKDKSQLVITSSNKSHTKTKCLSLPSQFSFKQDNIKPLFTQISSTSQMQKVHVNHCQNYFVIWREQQAQNTISIKKDNQKNYQIIHTLDPEESLSQMDIFDKYIVLYIQKNTKPIMRIISMKNNFTIQQPQLPYSIGKITPGINQVYSAKSLFFYISTPFVYSQGYQYDLQTKKFEVTQKFQMSGPKFNHNKYQIKTYDVPSLDGQKIPLTILCQKLSRQHPKKLMLKVYGFYGLPNEVSYDNTNYALLQNGWSVAYAHVRGGSDKGKRWHTQALKNRNLTWSDLEDCTAYLIKQKYTHPSLLFLQSHSAGAIAVWNLINKSPHLFKAVVLNYPFLDVLNTLLDEADPLAASDHAEFGNPIIDKKSFRVIESISPYENIQQKPYPFIYIVGGMNDYRCPVEQLAKFVKRFRTIAQTNNRFDQKIADKGIMLKVYDKASHLGSSDIGQENFNNCEVYGFLDHLIYQASNDCKY